VLSLPTAARQTKVKSWPIKWPVGNVFAYLALTFSVLYERATNTLLTDNPLLHFAYADYEETRMRYKKCEQIYKKFIDNPKNDPTLVCFTLLLSFTLCVSHSLYRHIFNI
jgi:hypothetical protein